MYQSVAAHPDGLPPPPSSSPAVGGERKSTTHNHHHHHGTSSDNHKNGRSNTLLVGRGENGFDGNGLLHKSSSSSSPPKTQDHSNVNLSNLGPKSGNSNPPQPPQKTHDSQIKTQPTHESTSGRNPNHNGGGGSRAGPGDVFLQWGQRKRSKRTVGDKFSGGHAMPPPPPPQHPPPASGGSNSRAGGGSCGGTKLRPHSNGVLYSRDAASGHSSSRHRNLEDKMGGGSNGSPSSKNTNGGSRSISRSALGKRSHSASERTDSNKRVARPPSPFGGSSSGGSIRKDKPTDPLLQSDHPNGTHHHHHLTSPPRSEADNNHGKGNGEAVEWPRIYIALSRKEKEDDFYAMKGTKLPHRPKKRSKAVDKTLQCCFPGMWLSDLTRARYEVRERKNVKKPKRRGLKGLESVDSDSE